MPRVKSISTNQGSELEAPDAQGESAGRVPLAKPIRQHISQLATDFRREHGLQDRSTGDRIARMFRASITPPSARGRKATQTVITAARLLQQKVPWSKIYPVVIPGYGDLPKFEREGRTGQLRRNVNRFLKRRGIPCPVPPERRRKVSKKPTSD